MYNSSQKNRFIEYYSTNEQAEKQLVSLFNSVSKFETEYNKDISCMNIRELQSVFDSMFGAKFKSRITKFSILRDYVRWCLTTGVDDANDSIFSVDLYGINRMRQMTVTCPFALNEFLNILFLPESKHTVDNVYRCLLWMAYSGMKESDALLVKVSDIHFDLLTIEYAGNSYPIYPESLEAFRCCVKLKSFRLEHPNYSETINVQKDRMPGNLLLRGIKSQPQAMAFRNEISKRNKIHIKNGDTNSSLSYTRIWLSGVFYRMFLREMAGFPVDFNGFVNMLIQHSYISPTISREAAHKKARDYLVDYERWKLTFK